MNQPYECKNCGARHGMGLEDTTTGNIIPLDLCRDCLFGGTVYRPTQLTCEWGGSLCGIVDGEIKNIADHLNETEKKITSSNE